MPVPYRLPPRWLSYDPLLLFPALTEAEATLLALSGLPFQRSWAEALQEVQFKREVAGTSRIEGADFTERELEAALLPSPAGLETRSQRQAAAAAATYRWIAALPPDRPVDGPLLLEIHRRMVTGCDDDHCPPGILRGAGQNVLFGIPRHRGVEGGSPCRTAFAGLVEALRTEFPRHPPLLQALALHYHLAAMHPFLDGNGRTARAAEALLLQRLGLRDVLFIPLSNYYCEEKAGYLRALAASAEAAHDLTPFLLFGLRGVAAQCRRLSGEIRGHLARALFRNTMTDLFGRLETPRKRVLGERHVRVLDLLLEEGTMALGDLERRSAHLYLLRNPGKALRRDLVHLAALGALGVEEREPAEESRISVRIDWPARITETEFLRRVREFPKARVHGFLSAEG
ncbi:MAG: Fic family protein [Planctomycetes bacterium]|nr:Fic family protein [Planctomycetota bacterium]